MAKVRIEIYNDGQKKKRWRIVHSNGRILAESGEGYSRLKSLTTALENLIETVKERNFVFKRIP